VQQRFIISGYHTFVAAVVADNPVWHEMLFKKMPHTGIIVRLQKSGRGTTFLPQGLFSQYIAALQKSLPGGPQIVVSPSRQIGPLNRHMFG
jgi:hypothetical protein